LCLLPAGHVLQISNDQVDLAVAQIIRQGRHGLSGPSAYRFRVADQIVQSLRSEIFGWILRQVEVRADIGGTGAVEFVAGEALHDEECLAGADRVCRRQR
jgi:hypothetical protein